MASDADNVSIWWRHNVIMEHPFSCDANNRTIMYAMHCRLDTHLVSSWHFVLRCGGPRRGGCRVVPGDGPRQGQAVHQLQRAGARVSTKSETDWRTYRCLQTETGEDPNRNEGTRTIQTTNARETRLAFFFSPIHWGYLTGTCAIPITQMPIKKQPRNIWSNMTWGHQEPRPNKTQQNGVHISFRIYVMTSSNGNILRVTGHLCGIFNGPRWFPRTKDSDAELLCFLWSASE